MKQFFLNVCASLYSFVILGRMNDLLRWLADYGFSIGVNWDTIWIWIIFGFPIFVAIPVGISYLAAVPANKLVRGSKFGFVVCAIILSFWIICAIVLCITDSIAYFNEYNDLRGWYLTFKIGAAITATICYLVMIFRIKDLESLD